MLKTRGCSSEPQAVTNMIFKPFNLEPLKVVIIYVIVSALLGVLPTLGQPLGTRLA